MNSAITGPASGGPVKQPSQARQQPRYAIVRGVLDGKHPPHQGHSEGQ
jgi:hypothetical protein